jgi:DNA cross-link repair 1A protein
VFLSVARALGIPVHLPRAKIELMKLMEIYDPALVTSDNASTPIHVVPLFAMNVLKLKGLLDSVQPRYTRLLAVKPTGWAMDGAETKSYGQISVLSVPYSEHSSFTDMKTFVKFIGAKRVVPTVNNSSRDRVQQMLAHLGVAKFAGKFTANSGSF